MEVMRCRCGGTGNRAGLIKHIEDCCGGKIRHKKTGEETQHWNKDKI